MTMMKQQRARRYDVQKQMSYVDCTFEMSLLVRSGTWKQQLLPQNRPQHRRESCRKLQDWNGGDRFFIIQDETLILTCLKREWTRCLGPQLEEEFLALLTAYCNHHRPKGPAMTRQYHQSHAVFQLYQCRPTKRLFVSWRYFFRNSYEETELSDLAEGFRFADDAIWK